MRLIKNVKPTDKNVKLDNKILQLMVKMSIFHNK